VISLQLNHFFVEKKAIVFSGSKDSKNRDSILQSFVFLKIENNITFLPLKHFDLLQWR